MPAPLRANIVSDRDRARVPVGRISSKTSATSKVGSRSRGSGYLTTSSTAMASGASDHSPTQGVACAAPRCYMSGTARASLARGRATGEPAMSHAHARTASAQALAHGQGSRPRSTATSSALRPARRRRGRRGQAHPRPSSSTSSHRATHCRGHARRVAFAPRSRPLAKLDGLAIEWQPARCRSSPPAPGPQDRLPTVKNVIAVAAGKGGVGKSTVSA